MTIERITKDRAASDVLTCDVSTPVHEAVAMLAGKRIGALPVMKDGTVAGIFSERDVIYRLASEGASCLDKKVGEVMTSPAITVTRADKIDDALSLMTKRRIRHLPVVEEGQLVGFVSIGDMVKLRMVEVEREAEELRSYIQTA